MARDPDGGDAFVFDLFDDDAPADAAPEGSTAPVMPGRTRRIATHAAAVLAIALGTGIAIDGAQDHERMERMRDIAGGVADLSSPLRQTWAWSGVVGPGETTTDVAVLGDVLAVESDDGLVALDPATGAEVWTVPLRADADCGPMVPPTWIDPATESLVCLQGTGGDREVVAVGPDGPTSAPRALDAATARRYGVPHTGPDGTVLRARRVGPPSAVDLSGAVCTSADECTGMITEGRDLVLRAEDAVTGAERWTVTVPFRAVDATQCTRTYGASWGSSQTRLVISGQLAPDAFGARVTADLVDLTGCGVQAAVTPDGTVLGAELEPGTSLVMSLREGGYAGTSFDGVAGATLYAADGDVVGEITGYPRRPRAIDGSEPAALLGVDEPGRRLRAYAADGTPRWDVTLQSGGQDFLAQVGDTAVITTGAGKVRGLDLATGAERWVWDGSDPSAEDDVGYFGNAHVAQAFTDGEVVLLLTEGETGSTQGLVALDASSGAVVWERPGGGTVTSFDPTDRGLVEQGIVGGLVAVDGNLLEVTPRGVRGLG
jgi:outer membrane protein assembly factor BamB